MNSYFCVARLGDVIDLPGEDLKYARRLYVRKDLPMLGSKPYYEFVAVPYKSSSEAFSALPVDEGLVIEGRLISRELEGHPLPVPIVVVMKYKPIGPTPQSEIDTWIEKSDPYVE